MRHVLILALMATAFAAGAQEIEPAVTTSSSALTPSAPGANAPAADPGAAGKAATDKAAADKAAAGKPGADKAAATGSPDAAATPKGGAQGKANAKSTAHDQIQLDTTQITGSRELPNVMYVVPWKRPELGDLGGRPAKSLVDEALAPVDRDVFRRQNRYFTALQADSAPRPTPPPAPAGSGVTPPGG